MTKILNFELKIKGGGRESGTCEVLRPATPKNLKRAPVTFRLLFLLGTENTLLSMLLNIWPQILSLEDLNNTALQNFCTIECGTFNCPPGLQFPVRLNNY